ncbi:MAG: inner membrane protein, partial [Gammaproteobacteria bacterium]
SISIIDPIFTLPLLALAGITAYTKRLLFARLAMLWVILYLGLGVVQRERVETIGLELALSRNHQPVRLVSRPAFGNLLLWKTIYETDDKYYVDGVRSAVDVTIFPGQSIEKLNLERDFPWLQKDSQQANDINRFEWFSSGFVAIHPNHTNRVIDVRYSMLPNEIDPLWMIELDPEKSIEQHVDFLQQRAGAREKLGVLWQMLLGRAPGNSAPGN